MLVRLVVFYADCIVCLLLPNLVDNLLFTADSFHPHVTAFTQDGIGRLMLLIACDIDFTTI
jgi:hypothetical protein